MKNKSLFYILLDTLYRLWPIFELPVVYAVVS